MPRWFATAVCPVAAALGGLLILVAGTHQLALTAGDGSFLDFEHERGWFTARGFYGPERLTGGHGYSSWTTPSAHLLLTNLDRSQAYELWLDLRSGRTGREQTEVSFLVDGRLTRRLRVGPAPTRVVLSIPARSENGAVVAIVASTLLGPSPEDGRLRGVVVDEARLRPSRGRFGVTAWVSVALMVAIALASIGLGLWRVGGAAWWLGSAGISAVFATLLVKDAAFAGGYVSWLIGLGLASLCAGGAAWLLSRPATARHALSTSAPVTAILVTAALAACALFAHPLAPFGDGVFQVHRAESVRAGRYFFTSITPKPFFEFPYAIALYVMASPVWPLFHGEIAHVWLLRAIDIALQVLVGVMMYGAASRAWHDRRIATLGVLLLLVAQAPFAAFTSGNLTNLFGDAVFALAMFGAVLAAGGRRVRIPILLAVTALLATAYLSHFSTLTVGIAAAWMASAALMLGRERTCQIAGILLLVATLAASAVAWGAYYSHFLPVYQQTIARVLSPEGHSSASAMTAPAARKIAVLLKPPATTADYASRLVDVMAAVGLLGLLRRRARDPLTLVLAGWIGACAAFAVLGVLTPLAMRATLNATPAFAIVAAYGFVDLADRTIVTRAVAAALVAAAVVGGLSPWVNWLG